MNNSRVYKDKRWQAARRRALAASGYRCRNCARFGKNRDADTVHHANPVNEFPELRYVAWNLVPLCAECHNKMHNREDGRLTALGEQWRARVSPRLL